MHTDRRQLAEKIARDLFINGSGQKAQRLVLTVDTPEKRDLGGWSLPAIIDRIENMLSGDPGVAVAPKEQVVMCAECWRREGEIVAMRETLAFARQQLAALFVNHPSLTRIDEALRAVAPPQERT